jgi:malonate-semialdehyde dehydrogenase (acetylating) / methylmalonate-semialdehyde dehydrogenase
MAIDTPIQSEAGRGVRTIRNYLGGQWVASTATDLLDVTSPASGEIIARVPLSTAEEVDRAARAAQDAFPGWRDVPPLDRSRFLFTLRDLMIRHWDEIARLVTTEHGKTLADARGSVQRAIENVEVAAGIPSLMMGYGLENGAGREIDEEAVRRPLGVFAAVGPFNFPAMVPFWFLPYAIATGNTFIVKPSEQVPLTQNFLFELLDQLGLPPGVVNLVNGAKGTVDALLDHPLIKGISFVGSTPVAKYIYARAAANGKRVQAGGGAKNMMVVMPDAVLDKTVPNVISSAFGSSGQRCLAGSVLVPVGAVHGPVRDALVTAARALKVGNGLEEGMEMGPVISAAAKERILKAIEQGKADGAELLVGGGPAEVPGYPGGHYLQPTIFDNVRPAMGLARDEIFGPVLAIMPAASLDQALTFIHDSPYGNAASIFTQHGGWAREFAYRADVGNVGVNIGVAAPMAYFPFGGAKESFFGTLHGQGREVIDFFCDRKVVIRRWFKEQGEDKGKHW